MLREHQVVCLSSLLWHGRPTSRHHLTRVLARDNQVLFVDPPTSLVRRRTLHRGRLERGQDDVVRLEPPPHLPARALSFGPVVAVERHRYGAAVSRAVRDLGWDRPVLWNASPLDFSSDIAERVPTRLHFLHLADAFWDYPGWGRLQEAAIRRCRETARFAVGSSPAIVARLREYGFDAYHLAHGVDVERFEPVARATVEPPGALAALPRPRFGFVGRLDRRLDVEVVRALAAGPGSVVLVGPSVLSAATTETLRRAGCVLPGEVSYHELPAWLAGFDVAVLPYRPLASVVASRPLKLLEYLAAGKPVVSSDIPAARELSPWVDIASAETFGDVAGRVWADEASGAPRATERLESVRAQSWSRRAEELSDLIETALEATSST